MREYRRIYEQHYGPIPVDIDGRTFDIHHDDGRRKNNDPFNLVACSISDHYFIHWLQGNYKACQAIAIRMNKSPELISALAKGHKPTEESRQRMSLAKIGKPFSEQHKQALKLSRQGKTPWVKGKRHSEKSIQKMSLVKIGKPSPKKGKHYDRRCTTQTSNYSRRRLVAWQAQTCVH